MSTRGSMDEADRMVDIDQVAIGEIIYLMRFGLSNSVDQMQELENENDFYSGHVFGDDRGVGLVLSRGCTTENCEGMPTGVASEQGGQPGGRHHTKGLRRKMSC
jgi:hypothetical protein